MTSRTIELRNRSTRWAVGTVLLFSVQVVYLVGVWVADYPDPPGWLALGGFFLLAGGCAFAAFRAAAFRVKVEIIEHHQGKDLPPNLSCWPVPEIFFISFPYLVSCVMGVFLGIGEPGYWATYVGFSLAFVLVVVVLRVKYLAGRDAVFGKYPAPSPDS